MLSAGFNVTEGEIVKERHTIREGRRLRVHGIPTTSNRSVFSPTNISLPVTPRSLSLITPVFRNVCFHGNRLPAVSGSLLVSSDAFKCRDVTFKLSHGERGFADKNEENNSCFGAFFLNVCAF